jgi:hypothetical protein
VHLFACGQGLGIEGKQVIDPLAELRRETRYASHFFSPGLKLVGKQYVTYTFVRHRAELGVGRQQFFFERCQRPMSMACRSISASGSDDEGFVLGGYLPGLPTAGRVLKHCFETTALMIPFSHIGDREMGAPQHFHDLLVCFSPMREEQNVRASDGAGVVLATFYDLCKTAISLAVSEITIFPLHPLCFWIIPNLDFIQSRGIAQRVS